MNKLYFKKYLTKKESDLKYILSFKIIIESCALIESYYHEIIKINNSAEIKEELLEKIFIIYFFYIFILSFIRFFISCLI